MWRELVFLFLPACRSNSSSSNFNTTWRPDVMCEMIGCCWGNSFHPPASVLTGQWTVGHHKSVTDVCGDVFSEVLWLESSCWVDGLWLSVWTQCTGLEVLTGLRDTASLCPGQVVDYSEQLTSFQQRWGSPKSNHLCLLLRNHLGNYISTIVSSIWRFLY